MIKLKGSSFLDAGFVYAPYVPLQITPTFEIINMFEFYMHEYAEFMREFYKRHSLWNVINKVNIFQNFIIKQNVPKRIQEDFCIGSFPKPTEYVQKYPTGLMIKDLYEESGIQCVGTIGLKRLKSGKLILHTEYNNTTYRSYGKKNIKTFEQLFCYSDFFLIKNFYGYIFSHSNLTDELKNEFKKELNVLKRELLNPPPNIRALWEKDLPNWPFQDYNS